MERNIPDNISNEEVDRQFGEEDRDMTEGESEIAGLLDKEFENFDDEDEYIPEEIL